MQKTVLIIDYHSDIAEMVAYTLALEKYAVKVARQKNEEVKILHEDPSIGCILLDWRSPEMPYDAFVAEVRKIRPEIGIILLTTSEEVERHTHELGMKCFVTDPFNIDALHAALQECGTWALAPQD